MGEGPVGFDGVGIFSALWNFLRVRKILGLHLRKHYAADDISQRQMGP